MKSTILATVLFALPFLTEAHSINHGNSFISKRHGASHKRHVAQMGMIKKRKTPGGGDVTAAPQNIAQGTYTTGCAVWHTVSEGEVCLGLIDKSSAGFDMAKFKKFNPSINADCSNLVTGAAYCVDTVAGTASTAAKVASGDDKFSAPKVQLAAPVAEKTSAASSADASNDDEDCEEDDSADNEDDEDCEEEDDDTADKVISVKVPAAKVKVQAASVQQKQQETSAVVAQKAKATPDVAPTPASTYVAPSSTYVAPSSTHVAPTSTYVAPSPSPSPEAPAASDNSGGNFAYTNMQATYYYQNGNPGSCGNYNSDDAMIVAVKSDIMGSQLCGKSVKLRNTATGKVVTATVADTCPTCEGLGIDLSKGLFEALSPGGLGLGVLNVDYSIL